MTGARYRGDLKAIAMQLVFSCHADCRASAEPMRDSACLAKQHASTRRGSGIEACGRGWRYRQAILLRPQRRKLGGDHVRRVLDGPAGAAVSLKSESENTVSLCYELYDGRSSL
jgi:hypothetical protein